MRTHVLSPVALILVGMVLVSLGVLNWRYVDRLQAASLDRLRASKRVRRMLNDSWLGSRRGGTAFLVVLGTAVIVNGIVQLLR